MKGDDDDTPARKFVYTGTGENGKRYGDWDAKGYARFNSLYDIVVHQRTTAMRRQLEISFKSNLLVLAGAPQGKSLRGTESDIVELRLMEILAN